MAPGFRQLRRGDQELSDLPWSKRAFVCHQCPKDGAADSSRGCPNWWKTVQTNTLGETRLWEECGFVQWPIYATEIIKASNRPAAAIESTRNEIAQGLARIAQATGRGLLNGGTGDAPRIEGTPIAD
jgi:hypothetical protein